MLRNYVKYDLIVISNERTFHRRSGQERPANDVRSKVHPFYSALPPRIICVSAASDGARSPLHAHICGHFFPHLVMAWTLPGDKAAAD